MIPRKTNSAIDIRPYRRAKRYITVGNVIGEFLMKFKQANVRRHTIRELQGLTDAQLEDIGIPRYDIRRVVNAKLTNRTNVGETQGVHRDARSNDAQIRLVDNDNQMAA